MPRFNKSYSNMNTEVCDFYVPLNRKTNRICKYFYGNKGKDIERCRHYCSILEDKRLMEEDTCIRSSN